MIKREEIANPDSCLNHAADDEPLFVFRGCDEFIHATVSYWLNKLKARYEYLRSTGHFQQTCGKTTEAKMSAKIAATQKFLDQLNDWQLKNPDKVHVPGFPASIKL